MMVFPLMAVLIDALFYADESIYIFWRMMGCMGLRFGGLILAREIRR